MLTPLTLTAQCGFWRASSAAQSDPAGSAIERLLPLTAFALITKRCRTNFFVEDFSTSNNAFIRRLYRKPSWYYCHVMSIISNPRPHIRPVLTRWRNQRELTFARFFLRPAILVLLAGLPMIAGAVPPPSAAAHSLPPLLRSLSRTGKIKIVRSFATKKPGLTGYVINEQGRNELVFADGGYLLIGRLISPQGDDLTAVYRQRYVPKPDVAAIVRKLRKNRRLIVQGPKQAPVLYVFADPNCIFCHRFYQMAEPEVKAGRLQLRWALVGFLKPSSADRAVAILSSPNPARALEENENHFNVSKEEGGIGPDRSRAKPIRRDLHANFTDMQATGSEGTPTILYQTASGKWAAQIGLPTKHWLRAYLKKKSRRAN